MSFCGAARPGPSFHRSFVHTNSCGSKAQPDENLTFQPVSLNFSLALSFRLETSADDDFSTWSRASSAKRRRNPLDYPHYLHVEYHLGDYLLTTDVAVLSPKKAKVYASAVESILVTPVIKENAVWIIWNEHADLNIDERSFEKLFSRGSGGILLVKCYDEFEKCPAYVRLDRPTGEDSERPIADNDLLRLLTMSNKQACNSAMKESPIKINMSHVQLNASGRSTSKRPRTSNQTLGPLPVAHRYGTCCLAFNLNHFLRFRQPKLLTARKPTRVTLNPVEPVQNSLLLRDETSFQDIIMGLEVNGSFLSREMRQKLKPIVICLDRLINLPTDPCKSFEEKNAQFSPLRVEWSFGNFPRHISQFYVRSSFIKMDETQVIFAGKYTNKQIIQMLYEKPFTLDIYDKDLRAALSPEEFGSEVSKLFGVDKIDHLISQPKANEIKPTREGMEAHAFASARVTVDLTELLRLKMNYFQGLQPVLPYRRKLSGPGPECPSFEDKSYVDYVGQNCLASISVDLNFDFLNTLGSEQVGEGVERFAVLTKRFNSIDGEQSRELLSKLGEKVVQNNARCLGIPQNSGKCNLQNAIHKRFAACLPPYLNKTSENNPVQGGADILHSYQKLITGFHLKDPLCELWILEVCDSQLSEELRSFLQQIFDKVDMENSFRVVEHGGMSFANRLYEDMDWSFRTLELPIPIEVLFHSPLCFLSSRTNHSMYETIKNLHRITQDFQINAFEFNQSLPRTQTLLVLMDAVFKLNVQDFQQSVGKFCF